MVNALVLTGMIVVGIIVLAVLGIVIWLVVRPAPSARSDRPAEPAASPAETPPQTESPELEFEVIRDVRGPHPRPRELDRESRRELLLLDERLHRAFFDHSAMSPDEWARIADDLLIVHDRVPVGILLERFEQATDTTVSAPPETDMPPREIASMLNKQLRPERRLKLIGTLDTPVEADVYAPE
ncbi:MAG: hypothetical protein ACOCZ7_00565 [Armatimonadota bacterium]